MLQLVFMLNPTKTFRHEARFWMLRVLLRIVCAPFFYVGFADFWVADQLNSLAVAFTDFHYLVCFYATRFAGVDGDAAERHDGWDSSAADVAHCSAKSNWLRAVVLCLPAWFRFAQCLRRYRDTREAFPHLVNAGKYSTTFFVVLFSTLRAWDEDGFGDDDDSLSGFFYPWVLAAVVNTTYAFAWDILMDWGFFDSNAGENRFLREEIVYSSKSYYYLAVLEDLVLRCSWAISAGLTRGLGVDGDILSFFTSTLEVFRRFVWNFFRLENEHLNNCGKT